MEDEDKLHDIGDFIPCNRVDTDCVKRSLYDAGFLSAVKEDDMLGYGIEIIGYRRD